MIEKYDREDSGIFCDVISILIYILFWKLLYLPEYSGIRMVIILLGCWSLFKYSKMYCTQVMLQQVSALRCMIVYCVCPTAVC